ncbi:MAG: FAD/NAD(P)-binding protein [Melioribacteraceae bacterium]|nr:FAD/NAD(P)-binding protein [Melioribacteraceae bacterium]
MVDYLIIGAGYAGLSAAALLAKNKFSTLLLESHSKIGGCASHYKRKDFTFDVGATTFSGIKPNQPLGRLFKELSIEPKLKKVDPGLIAKIDGKEIIRYADKLKWTEAASEYFNSSKQINFWQKIFEIDELAWEFLSHNNSIPPNSLVDYIKLTKPTNLRYAKLLYGIFNGIQKEINKFQLTDKIFTSFLEEQLLITTQNYAEQCTAFNFCNGIGISFRNLLFIRWNV